MKLYIQITFVILFGVVSLQAQTKNDKVILEKLNAVKVGDTLKVEDSWVINSGKEQISYSDFKGKWLLIDFWSTGCKPCIKDFPKLAKFYKAHKDDINVIAVSVDKTFEVYQKSAHRYKIELPHYFGGFTYANAIFNLNITTAESEKGGLKFYTITPQYVLINPEGKIIDKDLPKPSDSKFAKTLNAYMSE